MKHTKGGSTKAWRVLFALVVLLVLLAPVLAPHTAQAARPCDAPGTGLSGAWNMLADATMPDTMANHVSDQGNAGMFTAVANSSCP